MHKFFPSIFFNFEFIRILSAAPFGGAEVAECLVAASQIRDRDAESWHRAWYAQAEKALSLAEAASRTGDRVSARRAYLRASNYYRASAYMFLDHPPASGYPEPRVGRAAVAVATAFKSGIALLDGVDAVVLDIPYEAGATLPGWLYNPVSSATTPTEKKPVLIHLGGADSTQEELYYVYAATGPELGYAVLTFDGPGQGLVLRGRSAANARLRSRPDWENVVGHVIDHLETLAESDPELGLDLSRIAVAGASMGAYYALRAAADPRVKACVAVDPFYDMYDFAIGHMGPFGSVLRAWARGWVPTTVVNGIMGAVMALDFRTYWEVGLVQWFMGCATPTQALLQMRRYSFRLKDGGSFLARVKCPVLISSAGQSLYLRPGTDAKMVHDALTEVGARDKPVWLATSPEDGGLQAKIGAISLLAQKTFEFLDGHLGVVRGSCGRSESGDEYEHV
jgi:alpha-beta hydrolase superfamily lysophospholipase